MSKIKYLQKFIREFREALRGVKVCPMRDNPFENRETNNRKLLPEEDAAQPHRTAVQILFLHIRTRLEVWTLMCDEATRVKEHNDDNWRKIKHGRVYLKIRCTQKEI